jgi:hypothetical protein
LKQDGKCFWCGTEMQLLSLSDVGLYPFNSCTIDHLWDKLDPRRIKGEATPKVAACLKCNRERSQIKEFIKEHRNWTIIIRNNLNHIEDIIDETITY